MRRGFGETGASKNRRTQQPLCGFGREAHLTVGNLLPGFDGRYCHELFIDKVSSRQGTVQRGAALTQQTLDAEIPPQLLHREE